ncbi:hypothetical protein C8R47DRAFT_405047 [Mycena vitilis]|nr:hypothetical protein C8R47DRAFT_405047 [Mycena vitilis]
MPLARVNTSARSKSRSPIPPSPRPPTFLPPSHYAEAGGLSPRPPARNDSLTTSSESSHSQRQSESRRDSAFMPISSNSDSSFEFGETQKPKPLESKRFSIGTKASSRSQRESHMTNLPLVEAQLLPSLRDTINRMTRPPSRNFHAESPPVNHVVPNENYPPSPPMAQPYDTGAPSTPKPLKSALRAPTPKLQLRSPRSPAPAAPSSATSSRVASGSSARQNNIPDTPTRNRPRSRTDPGEPPTALTPLPKPDPRSPAKGTPGISSIPRPRGASGLRSASSTPRPRQSGDESSSSDLELRYELDARNRRSLRVVNGGAVSASESESDGEARVGQTRTGVGLGLGLDPPYASRSFASKLRARFTRTHSDADYVADEAAERRRKELLGLVKNLDKLGSQIPGPARKAGGSDYDGGVVVSGSGRVATPEPPRLMVSSTSGTYGEAERDPVRRDDRRTSLWQRSRSLSPAPPPPPKDHSVRESRTTRSPSRSPVIRPPSQIDDRADLMPNALRRHSVYHSAPPPPPISPPEPETRYGAEEDDLMSQSPESLYESHEHAEDAEWPQEPQEPQDAPTYLRGGVSAQDHRDPQFQRHSDDLANSDTVILALHSRLAAAREREALGIPPSASDAGRMGEGGAGQGERMSYMDSGASLARVGMSWEDGDGRGNGNGNGNGRSGHLSFGAEKLFRTLSGRTVDGDGKRDSWAGDPGYAFGQDDILKGRGRTVKDAVRPTSVAFSQSSSASSMYEEEHGEGSEHSEEPQQSEEFVQEGEEECHDENAHEEESLMDEPREDAWRSSLSPTTCTAIADRYGQPEIHRQEAIHNLFVTEEAFAARLTNTINLFILPLRMQDSKCYISGVPSEIARLFDWLEDILNLHTHLLSALRRVQEAQHPVVECVAEAVRGSFVKRLEVYQPYLARLVIVAGTIARLVADNTSDFGEFVRIQQDVEECAGWSLESLLVDPVARLGMYPAMFRKIHEFTPKVHGDYVPTVALLHSTEMVIKVMTEVKIREDEYDLVKSMSQRIKGLPPSVSLAKRGRRVLFQGQLLRVRAGSCDVAKAPEESPLRNLRARDTAGVPKRSSKLVEAVQEWDQRRERSGSNASASTMASYSTHSSAASSEFPVTPSSPHFPSRGPLPTLRSKLLGSPRPSTPQEGPQFSPRSATDSRAESTQLVQVFVFTDCVVVASTAKSRYTGSDEWTLLENVGIGRVLAVTELLDESNSEPPLLELDVLPADIKTLGESVVSENASLEVFHLRVPAPLNSTANNELRKTWVSAFRQSSKLTLRSISMLGGSTQGTDLDWDGPMSPQRPLPKSPSLIAHGDSSNPQRQEREERGWWSSCFHQVLREFQSRDVS